MNTTTLAGRAGQSGQTLYNSIRAAIIALQFAPGQLLSENELASRYNASRTPVRDALKILEREGLIRISSRRKTMVMPLDLGAYRQAVFARDVLESAAAKEAARLFRAGDERVLSANVAKQTAALEREDVPAFDQLDFEFHREVFRLAELDQLNTLVDSLRGLTDRMRVAHLAVLTQYNRFGVVDQHTAIAGAIESGDEESAETEMSLHVVSVFTRVAQLARARPEFFGGVGDDEVTRLEDHVVTRTRKRSKGRGKRLVLTNTANHNGRNTNMIEAQDLRNSMIAANPSLSRFNPLPRILCHDDFDNGINGWCELLGNHNGNLDIVRPVQGDMRPPQISNCTFFDIGTHGTMTGNYALKLQTRPKPGHMALAIKRLTSTKPGLVQLETYFAIKSEAWIGNRNGEVEIDGNIDPSQADFGDFCISNDISDGPRRAHCCVRYVNTDADGRLVQKWMSKTSVQTSSKMEWSGDAPPASDYHVRHPDDWIDIPDGYQPLCYNEVPTKINWHYLRWQFDTRTFRNTLLQVNGKLMDLTDVEVPQYPEGYYHGLKNLLNLSVDVRTHTSVRNFIFFDTILTSVDW